MNQDAHGMIRQAPVSLVALVLLGIILGYLAAHWEYSGRLALRNERVADLMAKIEDRAAAQCGPVSPLAVSPWLSPADRAGPSPAGCRRRAAGPFVFR